MTRKIALRTRGLTLIEVLLAVGLVTTLGFVAIEFTRTLLEFQTRAQASRELEQNGRVAFEFLERTIRFASAIRAPAAGISGAILELDVRDPSRSPTRVEVTNGALLITEGTASPWALTNSRINVHAFTATSLLPALTPAVHLSLSLEHTNPENVHALAVSEDFTQTVRLAR